MEERVWFNRTLDAMCKRGYIERLSVPKPSGKGFDRCFRLLKPYQDTSDVKQKQSNEVKPVEKLGEGGLLIDLPFELQVYRLIQLAGVKGATGQVS